MFRFHRKCLTALFAAIAATGGIIAFAGSATAWEPTRPVEFIVPAGTGGGADQMARMIQGIVQKHNLAPRPIVVINKSGGAGAEGFLDVKGSAGNPHKIVITLSNLFTTPLATGVPFNWRDLTPVSMLALDEFILWVNAETPYQSAKEYIDAVKAGGASKFRMAGTGSKQEDQIITAAIEQSSGVTFAYIPFKGGGEVAKQLVGKHVDSTVNNPIEAVALWRAGNLRPLCVFDEKRIGLTEMVTKTMAWGDVPTCKEQGLDIQYLMLRGIFMPASVPQEAVDYYVELVKKVRETPEWEQFMANGAFNTTFMSGEAYRDWVEKAEAQHKDLMTKAGFLAAKP